MGSVEGEIKNILSFDTTNEGMTIFDHIEHYQCKINTPNPVAIQKTPIEKFRFPVDQGVSIITNEVTIDYTMAVHVRNSIGVMIEELTKGDVRELPYDEYTIELSAPIKLYIMVESSCEISVTSEQVKLDFKDLKEVHVGARSHHERPSATIKSTDNPKDLIQAISYFGSSLKTTSCERSYPTLRGHPPDLILKDQLVIPSILEEPDTGITIEVPEDYQSIFVIAPLAYYLNAKINPGEVAKIKTEEGFIYNLEDTSRKFEDEVRRVLKQCFFLDCITRTEGYYQVNLYERDQIEPKLNIDFSTLYGQSISEQIRSYLNVSYETISDHIPKWKRVAYLEMKAKNVEILPYLINDLSIIHSDKKPNIREEDFELENNQDRRFKLEGEIKHRNHGKEWSNEGLRLGNDLDSTKKYIEVPESNALEHTWVGSGIPVSASKATLTAFKNRLNQNPTDGNIDIAVIVNDNQMVKEGTIVDEVYSSRDQLALTTQLYHQLTTKELREVLHEEHDFLHYIGHIDEGGFRCINGQLDVSELNNISIRTFLLNACVSYQQAIGLIESGAVAGIATTEPVLNSGAERIGKAIARLLNLGFPLISALEIAKSESIMGKNYSVIGDGSVNLTQAKSGIPSLCNIHPKGDTFNTVYETFLTKSKGLGTITIPYAKDNDQYYLASGETGKFEMDKNELIRFISMGEMPIRMRSTLYWGEENKFIEQL